MCHPPQPCFCYIPTQIGSTVYLQSYTKMHTHLYIWQTYQIHRHTCNLCHKLEIYFIYHQSKKNFECRFANANIMFNANIYTSCKQEFVNFVSEENNNMAIIPAKIYHCPIIFQWKHLTSQHLSQVGRPLGHLSCNWGKKKGNGWWQ